VSKTYAEVVPSQSTVAATSPAAEPRYQPIGTLSGPVASTTSGREHPVVPGDASRDFDSPTASSASWQPLIASRSPQPQPKPVVEYRDGSIVIDPAQLRPGKPIVIEYRGATAVAVKREDGSLDLYRVP